MNSRKSTSAVISSTATGTTKSSRGSFQSDNIISRQYLTSPDPTEKGHRRSMRSDQAPPLSIWGSQLTHGMTKFGQP